MMIKLLIYHTGMCIKGPESWWIAKSTTPQLVVNQSKINPQRPKGVVYWFWINLPLVRSLSILQSTNFSVLWFLQCAIHFRSNSHKKVNNWKVFQCTTIKISAKNWETLSNVHKKRATIQKRWCRNETFSIQWFQMQTTDTWWLDLKFSTAQIHIPIKVIYPKYSKHWPYWHTQLIVCAEKC